MNPDRMTSFRCCWCFAKIYVHADQDPERCYFGHLDWCRPRHLTGSIKRAADVAAGRRASGPRNDGALP